MALWLALPIAVPFIVACVIVRRRRRAARFVDLRSPDGSVVRRVRVAPLRLVPVDRDSTPPEAA